MLKYRRKHSRCRYCIFYKYIYAPIGMGYYKCLLKDIPLIDHLFLWRWQGMFCKWFKPEENDL